MTLVFLLFLAIEGTIKLCLETFLHCSEEAYIFIYTSHSYKF